ncbi:INO80 complex subunit B, partial [Pseudolycoriella hygida]
MSKKGETSDNDLLSTPRTKKLKKQKKQNQSLDLDDSEAVEVVDDNPMMSAAEMSAAERLKSLTPKSSAVKAKKKKGRKDSGTSSEEERWLDAIESGKLEQVDDELRKIKDPKLMTARQRAMYERGNDKEQMPGTEMLMSLPTGYKEKVLTAEAIQKAQIKSQKRKQLADEKREKDKKKTMERLLKKQESKTAKAGKNRNIKTTVPLISYKNTAKGSTLTIPPNFEFPFKEQKCYKTPEVQRCAMCENPK